jgi:hypothetical protein
VEPARPISRGDETRGAMISGANRGIGAERGSTEIDMNAATQPAEVARIVALALGCQPGEFQ